MQSISYLCAVNTFQKKKRRHHSSAKQRKQWRIILAVGIVVLILLVPIVIAGILWWRGLLPTREELPRYKERILIMLQGWKHARLPEGEVIGIDISHYQGNINFGELCFHIDNTRRMYSSPRKDTRQRNVDFVIAKATQGSNMQDAYYKQNKQGCREQGILFGAYHFYSLRSSVVQQADNFIHFAGLQKGDLVPVLDVEPVDGMLPQQDSVVKWLGIVKRYYGVQPLIYTNEGTYKNYFLKHNTLSKYSYWVARYGGREPSRMHVMWQCAESGRVGGVSGPVDINIFRGSMADLKHLYVIK